MTYPFPIGAATDPFFTAQDLLDVTREFPQAPVVYFGNPDQTVLCIGSVCSTKAVEWEGPTPGWTTLVYQQPVLVPPVREVPEPGYVIPLLLIVVLAWTVARLMSLAKKSRAAPKHQHVYHVPGVAELTSGEEIDFAGTCACGESITLCGGAWAAISRGEWQRIDRETHRSDSVCFESLAIWRRDAR